MNEARKNMQKAASLNPEAWEGWTTLVPGLYAYKPEGCEIEWLTPLTPSTQDLLTL